MGSKITSLTILENLGFNVPKLLLHLPQFEDRKTKIEKWNNLLLPVPPEYPEVRLSIRTQRDGETNTPHYANIREGHADQVVRDLSRDGYEILIFEGIDPKDCLLRGNMVRRPDTPALTLEWKEGPGTVRDLEKATPEPLMNLSIPLTVQGEEVTFNPSGIPKGIVGLVNHYFTVPYLAFKILEWSYYNKPIGKKHEQTIAWEIREWR